MLDRFKKYLKKETAKDNSSILNILAGIYSLTHLSKIKLTGKKNRLIRKGVFLNHCVISVNGNNNHIEFAPGTRLNHSHITILGSNCHISIGRLSNFVNADLYIEDDNGTIIFGRHNTICGFTHIAVIEGKSVEVGEDCLFSSNVIFRVGDSHSIISSDTKKRINPSQSIHIGNRVWFGNNSTILKGVELLNDTIIGTGSVVTHSSQKGNVIIAGNPSKIIKEGIYWEPARIPIE